MRRGKLCGISWDDVDLDASRITVRLQIAEQGCRKAKAPEKDGWHGEYRSKPKTRAGEDRVVELDAVSTGLLRTLAYRARQRAKHGAGSTPTRPT